MASYEQRVRELNDQRLRAWNRGKELLGRAAGEGRGMTADESYQYDRLNDDITRLDHERDQLVSSEGARAERETVDEALRSAIRPDEYNSARQHEKQVMADFMSGRSPRINIDLRRASYVSNAVRDGARGPELRGIFGDSGSSGGSLTIPSPVSSDVFQVMQSQNIVRQTRAHFMTTPTGAPTSVPVVSQGAATLVANQNTVFAGSDPTLASKVLHAYDHGNLVAIGNDLIVDAGIDLLSWVSNNIATAVAKLEEGYLLTGTGSAQPTGLMVGPPTGSAGTVATGGSLILGPSGAVLEKLIDVQYAVNSSYRQNGEWIVNDLTAATMRKIRSGAGGTVDNFVWSPSPTAGMINGTPDTFLGRPIYASSNVASMASDAKVLFYGDMSRFVVREVGGLQLERSADLYFDKNQLAVRGLSRLDSVFVDATAGVVLHQAVT